MNKILLSIIIPVYNVEKYIHRCLTSCCRQSDASLDEYEIIVINDGTPDNSMDIVKAYVNKYSNIKIVNQENCGLSAARNVGLKVATGKYIWFVDSDDWLYDNAVSSIIEKARLNPEVIALNYTLAYDDSSKNRNVFIPSIGDGKERLYKEFNCQVQFYAYNVNFLKKNSLSCYEGIYHEDLEFTPRMLYFAKDVVSVDNPVYYFYKRPNSITTTVNPKRSYDYMVVASHLLAFRQAHQDCPNRVIDIACRAVLNAFNLMAQCPVGERKKFIAHCSVFYSTITLLKESSSRLNRFRGQLLRYCPSVYMNCYRWLKSFSK